MKKILFLILIVMTATIIIPSLITYYYKSSDYTEEELTFLEVDKKDNRIKVYNPETEEIIDVSFEEYIEGVVAAEMPALFHEEALKAQAVAARTYAIKRINENDIIEEVNNIDFTNEKFNIGQAYIDVDEMKKRWGSKFNTYYKKIKKAVSETAGEIIIYDNEPIEAVFHSTSAGITEASENVWSQALPYLKSVESKQDEQAPDFIEEKEIDTTDVVNKLMESFTDLILTNGQLIQQIQIVERTPAGYIKTIQIGNKSLTGKQVREVLGLRSSNFTIKQIDDKLIFITKGYGHGAGMSQYGAEFMAQRGSSYKDILLHYYQGVEIKKIESIAI